MYKAVTLNLKYLYYFESKIAKLGDQSVTLYYIKKIHEFGL